MKMFYYADGYGSTFTVMAETEDQAKEYIKNKLNNEVEKARKDAEMEKKEKSKSTYKRDHYSFIKDFNKNDLKWIMKHKPEVFEVGEVLQSELA